MGELQTNINSLPKDFQGNAVQVASNIQNRDAESTPNESPLTVTATVDEIKIPNGAIIIVLRAKDADLRFGDNTTLDGTADKGYSLLPDGSAIAVPVSNGTSIHVKRDAAVSVTLFFHFEMLIP